MKKLLDEYVTPLIAVAVDEPAGCFYAMAVATAVGMAGIAALTVLGAAGIDDGWMAVALRRGYFRRVG